MTTRTTRPLAGFRWLVEGFQLLERNPGTLFGALGFFLLLSLLPSAVTLPLQMKMPGSLTVVIGVMVFSVLAGLALAPLQGGMFQVVDAIANDRPVRARDVFAPYRRADQFWPLVGFAFAIMLVVVALLAVVVLVIGAGSWTGVLQSMAAQQARAGEHAALPPHLGALIALFLLFIPIFMALFAIGYCQVALAGRSVTGAVADGVIGGLKNLHVLWILMLGGLVIALVLLLIMGVLIGLLSLLTQALGPVGVVVVAGLVYIAVLLPMYAAGFGFSYFLWRDVCAVDDADAAPQPLAA